MNFSNDELIILNTCLIIAENWFFKLPIKNQKATKNFKKGIDILQKKINNKLNGVVE